MYWGLEGTLGTQEPDGYRGIRGIGWLLGSVGSVWVIRGVSAGVGECQGCIGTGRDCRYSGPEGV